MQLRDLRQYAAARGWTLVGEYVDTGWSGKNAERPELRRCVADAKARKFDAIAVWKLDRWGAQFNSLLTIFSTSTPPESGLSRSRRVSTPIRATRFRGCSST